LPLLAFDFKTSSEVNFKHFSKPSFRENNSRRLFEASLDSSKFGKLGAGFETLDFRIEIKLS